PSPPPSFAEQILPYSFANPNNGTCVAISAQRLSQTASTVHIPAHGFAPASPANTWRRRQSLTSPARPSRKGASDTLAQFRTTPESSPQPPFAPGSAENSAASTRATRRLHLSLHPPFQSRCDLHHPARSKRRCHPERSGPALSPRGSQRPGLASPQPIGTRRNQTKIPNHRRGKAIPNTPRPTHQISEKSLQAECQPQKGTTLGNRKTCPASFNPALPCSSSQFNSSSAQGCNRRSAATR